MAPLTRRQNAVPLQTFPLPLLSPKVWLKAGSPKVCAARGLGTPRAPRGGWIRPSPALKPSADARAVRSLPRLLPNGRAPWTATHSRARRLQRRVLSGLRGPPRPSGCGVPLRAAQFRTKRALRPRLSKEACRINTGLFAVAPRQLGQKTVGAKSGAHYLAEFRNRARKVNLSRFPMVIRPNERPPW